MIKDNAQEADDTEHCDATVGIAVNRNMEHQEMTSFVNEDCDATMVRMAAFHKPKEYYSDYASITDLKQYFARPRVVHRGNYTATTPTSLFTYALTNNNIQSWFSPLFNRLDGAFGWRGTLCMRVQMIAQPFQAGRLKMVYFPFNRDGYERAIRLAPVSQLPGVELDLAESTSAVLKIPFVHPRRFFSVVSTGETPTDQDLGQFGLFAYTGVAIATGAAAPQYVLWAHIEDFEVIGAGPIQYQSGEFTKTSTSAAEEKAIPGNLSNVLMAGSKLVSWGGSKIPLISSYAGATSWLMKEAAKVASSYGWSKPAITSAIMRMQNTYNGYQFNADGADPAFNLGGFAENSLAPMPGFAGTDLDEMAFDYIKKVYSAINIVNVEDTQDANNILYTCNLCPMALSYANVDSNVQTTPLNGFSIWPSSIMGIANCFKLYRGGLKFRVKISKTKFHTGRLLLGFSPRDPLDSNVSVGRAFVPADRSDMQFKSKIWDLREQNVMDFEVPFLSPYPYLEVNQSYGTFFVSVIEPLRGPDTVASVVPMVIEVAGADDLEFAVPWTGDYTLSPTTTTFVAQSGEFEPFHVPKDEDAAGFCIGERFNSVKQLISRATLHDIEPGAGSVNLPFRFSQPQWSDVGVRDNLIDYDPTLLNYWGGFFGLYRGSRVYHGVTFGDGACLSGYYTYGGTLQNLNWNSLITENKTGLHMRLPYYNKTSRSIVYGSNNVTPQLRPFMNLSSTADSTKASVTVRAGDDFQFGYYLGCPPLTPVIQDGTRFNLTSNDFVAASIEARTAV